MIKIIITWSVVYLKFNIEKGAVYAKVSFFYWCFRCFSFIIFSLSDANASLLETFDRGEERIGIYSTVGEKSNLNGVVLDNGGNISFDGYYAFGKNG